MTEQQLPTQLPRARDSEYREIYSNNSQTNMGAFDISIIFQKTTEVAPTQMAVVDQVSVTLSPQHFKAFVRSLSEALTAYEAAFGKLSISERDTAPQRTAAEIVGLISAAREVGNLPKSSSTEPPQPSKRSRGASQKKETEP